MIMETPDALVAYRYDPWGNGVFFAARCRGLSVSTNLPGQTLNRIVHGPGEPARPPAGSLVRMSGGQESARVGAYICR